jgi:ApaG protein
MHTEDPYQAETHGIVVRVRPSFLGGQSDPDEGRWVWAYQIEIVNLTPTPVQLVARRWTITDARGLSEQVAGPGVVGEQPTIQPGASYSYVSGCPLATASGSMVGAYVMVDDLGRTFEVAIPAFSLDVPGVERLLN